MQGHFWIVIFAFLTSSLFFGMFSQDATSQLSIDNLTYSNTSRIDLSSISSPSISGASALTFPQIFNKTENSVVQITSSSPVGEGLVIRNGEQIPPDNLALGSGFVYDQEGHIITNNHVISNPNDVEVTFVDGDSYSAKVVGKDPYSDIAVLQITDDSFQKRIQPLMPANSSALQVGEEVVAIGNPFGLSGTLTSGVISQIGRVLPNDITGYSIADIIQTDAAINPGNSGGPLLNSKGEVVGMNTAIFSNTGLYSGVGFAIPSNMVQKVVSALLKNGSYEHPYIGISGITLSRELANATGLNDTKGILVVDITAESPADKAGIRGGDVLTYVDGQDIRLGGDLIVAVDNQSVRAMEDLLSYLEDQKAVGDHIQFSVIRDGKVQDIDLTLAARPTAGVENESQTSQGPDEVRQRPALGVNGINMTPELAERMNLTQSLKGFLVEDIISGGPADLAGIRGGYKVAYINGSQVNLGGDIIVGIDESVVRTIQDIQSYLDSKNVGDNILLHMIRDKQEIAVPLTLGISQSQQQIPEQNPFELIPQPPFSQNDPFSGGGDFFGDMYNRCVEGAGREICDQLFGR